MTSRFLLVLSLVMLSDLAHAQEKAEVAGEGTHRYVWNLAWGDLPDGKDLGNTHGCMVVDKQGLIYANTDTEQAVVVFDAAGKFIKAFGAELKGGLHGMCITEEDGKEYLYLSHLGRSEVLKTTLDGEILWTLGYPKESGIYSKASEYKPTGVAVAPNGDIFVGDGYGKSWVHQFTKDRKYVRSFGGRGTEPGKMQTPHGLWIDKRGAEPQLLVADRENGRIQIFDLTGNLKSVVTGFLRRPCSFSAHGGDIAIADLAGRVTIMNAKNELICHLGDNPDPKQRAQNGTPKSEHGRFVFFSPHSCTFDQKGNLYVMDWNRFGRLTQLKRVL